MSVWNRVLKFRRDIPYNIFVKNVRNDHNFFTRRVIHPQKAAYRENDNKAKIIKKSLDIKKPTFVNAIELLKNKPNLPKKDYYGILGVKKNSSFNEIKEAYYILAKKFHPDSKLGAAVGNAQKFQEISEAYDILSDENKRMEYDLHGVTKKVIPQWRSLSALSSKIRTKSEFDRKQRERNFTEECMPVVEEVGLTITFLQAVQGTRKEVTVKTASICKSCNGGVSRQHKRLEVCRLCNGTGKQVAASRGSIEKTPCKACKGGRYTSRQECTTCNNSGCVTTQVNVMVDIPKGSNSGDVLKVPHPDGKSTLNVKLTVVKNRHYERIENDIYTEKYLKISEAILGGVFKIRGIYEDFEVTIPEGTESHTTVRIPGKGVRTDSCVGDHVITIKIKIPKNLTSKQREMLELLAKIENSYRVNQMV